MNLQQYKFVFIAIGLIGVLLIASPVFADVISFPSSEHFSELYILGPEQMATNIPFNIVAGQNYLIYLGVGNQLDSCTHYVTYIKLRNQTEPFPDKVTQSDSSLAPLYEYRIFIQKGVNWTSPMTFSVQNITFSNNQSILGRLIINDLEFDVNKLAQFDEINNGYFYQIFIELWISNPTIEKLEYQNRFVYFWFNLTSTT